MSQKICKNAISINELGHISFVQNLAKFAKIRNIWENLQQMWKFANYAKIRELSKKKLKLGQNFANCKKKIATFCKNEQLYPIFAFRNKFLWEFANYAKIHWLWENSQLCKTLRIKFKIRKILQMYATIENVLSSSKNKVHFILRIIFDINE